MTSYGCLITGGIHFRTKLISYQTITFGGTPPLIEQPRSCWSRVDIAMNMIRASVFTVHRYTVVPRDEIIFRGRKLVHCDSLSFVHSFIHSFIHSCMHACMHAFMHSCIHAFMHSFIHAFMHSCIHAFIRSSIHSFIHYHSWSLINSFIIINHYESLSCTIIHCHWSSLSFMIVHSCSCTIIHYQSVSFIRSFVHSFIHSVIYIFKEGASRWIHEPRTCTKKHQDSKKKKKKKKKKKNMLSWNNHEGCSAETSISIG